MEQIETAGYEAYFVGGSVRDVLLGHPIHDMDIATSAFSAEIKSPRTGRGHQTRHGLAEGIN